MFIQILLLLRVWRLQGEQWVAAVVFQGAVQWLKEEMSCSSGGLCDFRQVTCPL